MTEPLVAIIIVNFNGKDDTIKCLESLRQDRYPNKLIIVIDNGSANDSVAVIRGAFPDVVLIEAGKNLGFGGGNNLGIRHAIAAGADYVYLINNDTTSEPDALAELVKAAMDNPGFGILAPVIHYMAEPGEIWFCGATLNPRTLEALHDNSSPPARGDPLREIPWATGCAMLIPAKLIADLGGFDERFFLCSEDVDLCIRAGAAGHRIGLVPPARIFHKVSASYYLNPESTRHGLRGKILLQRIHGGRGWRQRAAGILLGALRRNAREILAGTPGAVASLRSTLGATRPGLLRRERPAPGNAAPKPGRG